MSAGGWGRVRENYKFSGRGRGPGQEDGDFSGEQTVIVY